MVIYYTDFMKKIANCLKLNKIDDIIYLFIYFFYFNNLQIRNDSFTGKHMKEI